MWLSQNPSPPSRGQDRTQPTSEKKTGSRICRPHSILSRTQHWVIRTNILYMYRIFSRQQVVYTLYSFSAVSYVTDGVLGGYLLNPRDVTGKQRGLGVVLGPPGQGGLNQLSQHWRRETSKQTGPWRGEQLEPDPASRHLSSLTTHPSPHFPPTPTG